MSKKSLSDSGVNGLLFQLVRYAVGADDALPQRISREEWRRLYEVGVQQALIGVMFEGIKRMPDELLPEDELLMQWYRDADYIAEMNEKVEMESKRWTERFAEQGLWSCILKGQGNAAMYDEPKCRTSGDIDIYVEGGQDKVLDVVGRMGLTGDACYHHIHLDRMEGETAVEVHYRASYGGLTDRCNGRIEVWLEKEIKNAKERGGYNVPSVRFNKVMQLAHMQHHFAFDGMSLKQLLDYYHVLRQEVDDDMSRELKYLGLDYFARGIMYIMQEVFHLDRKHLIIAPDERRGKIILENVMEGGTFGFYRKDKYAGQGFLSRNMHHTADLLYFCWLFPNQYYKTLNRYVMRFVYQRMLGKEYKEEDL